MPSKLVSIVALFIPFAAVAGCDSIDHMIHPHGDPALIKEAKIPFDRAQSLALAARSGKVKEWELEKETGGSGLRYSFDIDVNGAIYEVGVDASNGAILENGQESEDDEKGEK